MSTDALSLLRALGGGVRPPGIASVGALPGTARAGATPGVPFADLLTKAQAGEITSSLPVTVASGAGVSLSDDQLRRLSVAADRAEASGATRPLVLIDGMALHLDVATRQVTGKVDLGPESALSGIDGVVRAPEAEASGTGAAAVASVGVPAVGVSGMNATLMRALARVGAERGSGSGDDRTAA